MVVRVVKNDSRPSGVDLFDEVGKNIGDKVYKIVIFSEGASKPKGVIYIDDVVLEDVYVDVDTIDFNGRRFIEVSK